MTSFDPKLLGHPDIFG